VEVVTRVTLYQGPEPVRTRGAACRLYPNPAIGRTQRAGSVRLPAIVTPAGRGHLPVKRILAFAFFLLFLAGIAFVNLKGLQRTAPQGGDDTRAIAADPS